jgi:CheY-like chemotaxis protein
MDKIKILWVDDEIDLLKPHTMFLKQKGYDVVTVSNGHDALEECEQDKMIDVVFLDESMPGLTGLETLSRIKAMRPNLPVVMITKNEAETVMEDAIGQEIADYLIKPVNPNQILLTLKKLIDNKRLVSERTTSDYQQNFRELFMQIQSGMNYEEWVETYKKLIGWELRLDTSGSEDMSEILSTQKAEANTEFSKFIVKNYVDWMGPKKDKAPTMSHNLLKNKIFPHVGDGIPTIMLLLDNLRLDQWKVIEPLISEMFRVEEEDYFYSILPATTQYSRNAIFAGMMPADIDARYPNWWFNDNEEGGKNLREPDLLTENITKIMRKSWKHDYVKITNVAHGKHLEDNILHYLKNDFTAIVYNFIDMLSHARTEMEVLKELAKDERAYRSLTRSWFLHSPLYTALQKISEKKVRLFVTTDHGTIRVKTPSRVVGDKETTTNLRYKVGKNLQYDRRDVLEIRDPKTVGLPRPNISSTFIFAKEDAYFLYPNNYNHFNNFYRNTFQHGGISMEELICPVIRLSGKG